VIGKLLSGILPGLFDVIDQTVTDKDQAAQIKHSLKTQILNNQAGTLQAQAKLVLGEIQGESWLQRNWRPILMLVVVSIVANNYLISPYLGMMIGRQIVLVLPDRLWDLMTLGVSGYVMGRSGEKMVRAWKEPEKIDKENIQWHN